MTIDITAARAINSQIRALTKRVEALEDDRGRLLGSRERLSTSETAERIDKLEAAALACDGDGYDDRWDPMLHGGPLQPERIDEWKVTSAPSGEPICSLSSYGHWPIPGLDRVAVLARYIASIPPSTTLWLLAAAREVEFLRVECAKWKAFEAANVKEYRLVEEQVRERIVKEKRATPSEATRHDGSDWAPPLATESYLIGPTESIASSTEARVVEEIARWLDCVAIEHELAGFVRAGKWKAEP